MAEDVVHIRTRKMEPLKVGDKVFKSAYDWELTEKDLQKATLELGETEQKKKACLRKLKEKLSKESDVKYRQDDCYLLRYLRVKKYDVKKAYHNIKLFFQERKKHSNFFILPQNLKSIQDLNFFTILPYADEEGTILFWLNFNRWNPAERPFKDIAQTITNVCDIVSMNPHCHINGAIGIWNLSGMSMRHVSELLLNGQFLTIISIMQNGYPWRVKKMIMLHTNQLVRFVYSIVRPLLTRKIRERNGYPWRVKKMIMLHTNQLVRFVYSIVRPLLTRKIRERVLLLGSDLTQLHQHVDPALLPESLKGTLKDEECDISEHILDNLPYIKYERSFMFP